MNSGVLFDTCAAIWWSAGTTFAPKIRHDIQAARASGRAFMSPISAWEVAILDERGRPVVASPALDWYTMLTGLAGFGEAELTAAILVASRALPGSPPRDPADRIMIATAREMGLVLVTRDKPILDYGATGHVRTLKC